MQRTTKNNKHILKFESSIDVRMNSWLRKGHEFSGGMSKPGGRSFSIEWDEEYRFECDSSEEHTKIEATQWSLPLKIEMDKCYFASTDSDDSLASGLHRFVTHFIDCVEHIFLAIGQMQFKLDGRPILFRQAGSAEWRKLNYERRTIDLEEIFYEYSLMGDTGHTDVVCMEAEDEDSLETSWQFIIDSIASYESGHFRGCVVYACSALELEMAPVVREWFERNTVTGANILIENAITDMSNPVKFEIFFKCLEDTSLAVLTAKQRLSLLEELKWLNTVRNKVAHSGYKVSPEEAEKAIRIAGIVLRLIWVYSRRTFFEGKGLGDIFEDFEARMRAIKIK